MNAKSSEPIDGVGSVSTLPAPTTAVAAASAWRVSSFVLMVAG